MQRFARRRARAIDIVVVRINDAIGEKFLTKRRLLCLTSDFSQP
jgi:hypothetical protein